MTNDTGSSTNDSLLATILAEETFRPSEPATVAETGLPSDLIESLVCKRLAVVGKASGRQLADFICLPFGILEPTFQDLRARQLMVHKGSAPFNDYVYELTEQGRESARAALASCAYVGPAPVPLMDYVLSAEAQSIRAETPQRDELTAAFDDISIDEDLFESLGPAINSGAGLFLYGEPGNGKSTIAKRITMCFGHRVWIPHAIYEDGQIIKFYDSALHEVDKTGESRLLKDASGDRRWLRIRRPTVVVGGELTMDSLEVRHDPHSNVSEAPIQLKSNCGCLLIDDFGRQRIEPAELLNRWIVPLENRVDYLTLSTGKKIQVPFEQLIIFSTNLEPQDLVDDAFLRRIPYKIHIVDPDESEFRQLFQIYAERHGFEYDAAAVDHLITIHYRRSGRKPRRCHPRDLLSLVRNYCVYNGLPLQIKPDYFDRVVRSYFTNVTVAPPVPATGSAKAEQMATPALPVGGPADAQRTIPTPIFPVGS